MATKEQVLEALGKIIDPDFQRDIVSLGFVQDLEIDGGKVSFTIELTTPACPLKSSFEKQARELVGALDGVEQVEVRMSARQQKGHKLAREDSGLKGVKQILAVSSCKGGVGKSTVAALLARTLAARGHSVGLLDADIYGPSIPTLFNQHDPAIYATPDEKFVPVAAEGLKLMSFGFLAGDGPAVLRGPLVAQYMQQLLHGVAWGDLDYLVIDLPPGTGDIQLTISQSVQVDAAVIVTTPHQLSLTDVRKGIMMFDKVNVPVLGVVENMSYFVCDGCSKRHYIFGEAGARSLEAKFGLETLAEIPVSGKLSSSLDTLAGTEIADKTTDAVVRALGRRSVQKSRVPKVDFDEKYITLTWPDTGEVDRVPNIELRKACTCALCVDEMTNAPLLDPEKIPADIRAEKVGIIGNYAVAIDWSDGHNTGYFPYGAIRDLARKHKA